MRKRNPKAIKAQQFLEEQPHITPIELSNMFKIPYQTAYNISKKVKQPLTNVRAKKPAVIQGFTGRQYELMNTKAMPFSVEEVLQEAQKGKQDMVNNPPHYTKGGVEVIDFIEAKELNYHLGNAVKYITRAEHKGNKKQDIEKAIWYLNRELNKVV
jgi:hypothetical protein